MTTKINFEKMQKLAHELLLEFWEEGTFPIDTIKLANRISQKRKDLKIYTYSKLASELKISTKYFEKISEHGYTYLTQDKKHIIAYNDKIENKNTVQWTVGHELGHYTGKHTLKPSEIYTFSDGHSKEIKEVEADYFAKNLMLPLPLLYSLNLGDSYILSPYDIMSISNLNYTPASYIYAHLQKLSPSIVNKIPYKKEIEELFAFELFCLKTF